MFLWLVFVTVVLWTVVYRYKRRRMYELASKIPPAGKELPVIGIAHSLSGSTENIMTAMKNFSYTAIKNDGIVTAWLAHILYFVMTDPVDTEMILKACLEKDDLHRFIRNIIGNGGIFAPVSIWRRRRKVLMPAFSPKIVENFVEVFVEQSKKLVEKLDESTAKGKFSIWPNVSAYTLDSVCQTVMGVKINAQANPNTPFLVAMMTIFNLACRRIFHLWQQPNWLYRFSSDYETHEKCLRTLNGFTNDVVKNKREEIKNQTNDKMESGKNNGLEGYKIHTFLDLLIRFSGGENGYTNEELREEVITLAVAGTDTSAVGICYTLALLAKYPEIQEKVYQELQEVFGDTDRPLVKEDLPKLEYLTRVVKESLRLFPPVPFIIRKILEDVKLPSGRVIPGGSGVAISIWGIHRDPKYWGPDAEKFDPDRFLPERLNLPHSCCYMPFSQGPRNCLGYQYALMSAKTVISSVVRKFRILGEAEKSSVPSFRVKLDIMMKDVDGYHLALERRKQPTMPS